MQNGFKQRCYLLGANGIKKEKEGKQIDFSIVRLAIKDEFGGWDKAEFIYGKASDAVGINSMVESGIVLADCDFVTARDFKTGGLTLRLKNLSVVKG